MNKPQILSISLFLFFGMFFCEQVNALTISPAKNEINADKGTSQNIQLQLRNETNLAETITFIVKPFIAGEISGSPQFIDEQNVDYINWIQIPQSELIINANQIKDIQIPLVIPPDAEPGGYYFAIFAKTKSMNSINNVSASNEVGALYFLTINGESIIKARTSNIKLKKFPLLFFPAKIEYTLKNIGALHIKPEGKITINNLYSKKTYSQTINNDGLIVLPNSERVLSEKLNLRDLWFSSLNPIRFGIYEIKLDIENNENNEANKVRFILHSPSAYAILLILFTWFVKKIIKNKLSQK